MKAINIPRAQAEKIESLGNSVLISISSDLEAKASLSVEGENVLKVFFPDITARIDYKGHFYDPMSGDTALEIINFIEKNLDKDLIVHCAAGVSRSSAVCMFAHIMYGYDLKEDYWKVSHPNTHVIGELIKIKKQRDSLNQS